MEVRPLEIRILKAHDLKDVNLMSKMDVYAVVSISGDHLNNPKLKTAVDKDGGRSPKWNFPMKFTVDEASVMENRLTLDIKIVSHRSLGDRDIGAVHVQIKELFDSCGGVGDGDGKKEAAEEEKSSTYSVRLSNGKAKGTLVLAYKFGGKYEIEVPPPPPSYSEKGVDAPPSMAYPAGYPGTSSAYPAYPPPPPGGYPYAPPPGTCHGPPGGYPYAPQPGMFPPPPPGGYPYAPPPGPCPPPPLGGYPYAPPPGPCPPPHGGMYPPPGYGYPPMQPPQGPKKGGGGMGLGLGAGLLGGLLIGDMISDF